MRWALLLWACAGPAPDAAAPPPEPTEQAVDAVPDEGLAALPEDYALPEGSTLLLRTVDVRARPHPAWRTRWTKDAALVGEIDGFVAYLPEVGAVRLRLDPVVAEVRRCPDERDPDGTREVRTFHLEVERDDGTLRRVPLLGEPDALLDGAGDLHARVHLDALVGPYALVTTHLYARTCDRDDGSTAARQVRLDLRTGKLGDPVDDPAIVEALPSLRERAMSKLAERRAGARGEVDAPHQLVPVQLLVHKLEGGRGVGLRLEGPAVPSGSDADWSTGTVAPVVALDAAPEWMADSLADADPGIGLPQAADAARRAVAVWMLSTEQPAPSVKSE